jgi:hypothetical protein
MCVGVRVKCRETIPYFRQERRAVAPTLPIVSPVSICGRVALWTQLRPKWLSGSPSEKMVWQLLLSSVRALATAAALMADALACVDECEEEPNKEFKYSASSNYKQSHSFYCR